MPSHVQSYEILLDFSNDTSAAVSIQLAQEYGQNSNAVLLDPSEKLTLILDSGSVYRYAVKTGGQSSSFYKVANVRARSWRDIQCNISNLFACPNSLYRDPSLPIDGVVVDRLWRDYKISMYLE
ncbi:hypothetical protein D9758_000199 [Tetrapyrgos nigripes]|uniref:Uncharacterized protein n=1 Tax=Tetrapyrgos nigripes TaxID=182062 RepID=A0A8H5LZ69_9AGAR|nr:hypothetical protein D9758_000199 [Tetrapyrgos nigripes]